VQRAFDATVLHPAFVQLGVFMGADIVGSAELAARQVKQRDVRS